MSEMCDICCFDFNKSTRAQIKCQNKDCDIAACKSCVRKYLFTQSNDPHCLGCKIAYDDKFMVMNLNRNWCEKEYKNHRKSILLEQQMARMPDTVEAADRFKQLYKYDKQNEAYENQITELRRQLRELKNKKETNLREKNGIMQNIRQGKTTTQKRKFIMACPDNECRGYLSSGYKCEICKKFTCPSCLQVIGLDKNSQDHKCNENDVKTAEFIKSTTKPCPGCGERIHKIQGCDQMWCTQCHVAFSWRTGIIENGVIHNPHFYEYQRQNAPANQHALLRNCNRMPQMWELNQVLLNKSYGFSKATKIWKAFVKNLFNIHRHFNHLRYVELQKARDKIRDLRNLQQDRIHFLIKTISKEELGKIVIKKDKQRKKFTEMIHIYELIDNVGIDLFRWILNHLTSIPKSEKDIPKVIEPVHIKLREIEKLRVYANSHLANVSISYNVTVPQFRVKSWKINKEKFTIEGVKNRFT